MAERIVKPEDVELCSQVDDLTTIVKADDATTIQLQQVVPTRIVKSTDPRLRCGALNLTLWGEAFVGRHFILSIATSTHVIHFSDIEMIREVLKLRAWTRDLLLDGPETGLLTTRLLTPEVVDYTYTLSDVLVYVDRLIAADEGLFTLSAEGADLRVERPFSVEPFALTWDVAEAALLADRRLSPAALALTWGVVEAGLSVGRLLSAAPAALQITPVDLVLTREVPLVAEPAAFVLTPVDAALRSAATLQAEATAFQLGVLAASLSTSRPIVIEPAAFVLTGTDIGYTWDHILETETASFGVVAPEIYFPQDYTLEADTLQLVLTGYDVDAYSVNIPLVAEPATFNLGLEIVDLGKQKAITAVRRNLSLGRKPATLIRKWRMFTTVRTYALGRKQAYFLRERIMPAETRALQIVDQNVNLKLNEQKNTVLRADKRALTLTRRAANLIYKWRLTADKRSYSIVLRSAAFNRTFGAAVIADVAAFNIATMSAQLTVVRMYRMTASVRSYTLGAGDLNYIWLRHYWLSAENTSYILTINAVFSEVIAAEGDDDYAAWMAVV